MAFVAKYRYVTPVTPLLALLYILVNPVTAPAHITETASPSTGDGPVTRYGVCR